MSFFSEIRAKLGLDISGFERGLARANKDLDKFKEKQSKKNIFEGLRQGSASIAVALGVNMQNIADHIARFFTGFSKEAEESLNNLVSATENAARQQEAALEKLKAKQKNLTEQVDKIDEAARLKKLTLHQKEQEQLLAALALEGRVANTVDGSIQNLEARVALDEKNKELAETRVAIAEVEKQKTEEINEAKKRQGEIDEANRERARELADAEFSAQKQLDDMRREAAFEAMSDEQKLQALRLEGMAALALANETGMAQDALAVEQLRKKYNDLLAKMKESAKQLQTLGSQSSGMKSGETGFTTDAKGRRVGERQVGADGKVRLRGAVISTEDIARTDATKAANAKETAQIQANKILTSIEKKLTPPDGTATAGGTASTSSK